MQGGIMERIYKSDSGDKRCVNSFGGEISLKAVAWEDQMEMRG
jgi:hypothetical protein